MSGAIFCLSLYHVCPAHSRKSVGSAGLHFGALSEEYPIWNDFLTFSTGFSTDFVKKKWGFPQCFPLFPPSFPQKIEFWVIHDVFQNGKRGKIWREKGANSLFFEKKVEAKNLFSAAFRAWGKSASPLWNFWRRSFPQTLPGKNHVWKTVGKPGFSTNFAGKKEKRPRGRTARRGAGMLENLYGPVDAVDGDFAGEDLLLAAVGADDELAVGVHVDGCAAACAAARQIEGDVAA